MLGTIYGLSAQLLTTNTSHKLGNFANIAILTLLLLSANSATFACEFTAVKFVSDFEGGRLNACNQLDENRFQLTIDAENRPVNPSPWYAFRVENQTPKTQRLTLELNLVDAKPRYLPKLSIDGKHWTPIPFTVNNGKMSFTISITNQAVWVAAQALILNQDYIDWQQKIAALSPNISLINLGKSRQNRPIWSMQYVDKNTKEVAKEWLVIVGRQHPPEVSGAIALQAFVESLLSKESQVNNADFFKRFKLLIVPNINPDGVASGNWRHSSAGVDLNRDWNHFKQPETSLVKDEINRLLGNTEKLVFALDFHSTQQDIFYTMPSDYHVAPALFSQEWIAELKKQTVSSFTVRERPGSSPGRGVFKQYIADTYNVHAVTYEMGDNTPNYLIKHVADIAAQTLMLKMLNTPAEAFAYSPVNNVIIEPGATPLEH